MKGIVGRIFATGFVIFVVMQFSGITALADVRVYAEGAYTDTDLAVYIYADITDGTELRSAGVKFKYDDTKLSIDTDPDKPTVKNDSVWFLGDGTPEGNNAYMEPETSTPGEVIIILGKLNTSNTAEGVSGDRVLLGIVRFSRLESSMPFSDSTMGIELGKIGPEGNFANFVHVDMTEMDSEVNFDTIIIFERGDANGDGNINISDVTEIRNIVFNEIPEVCYADCNDDGNVNISDVTCIRDKVFQ